MIRKANMIFGKNGNGYLTIKISLPVPWVKELGFSEENKKAIIELKNDKIIIMKECFNMLLIKNKFGNFLGDRFDYELENGLLLFVNDWNGESYLRAFNPETNEWNNNSFKAIYRCDLENIDLEELEEDSPEWDNAIELVGFVEN